MSLLLLRRKCTFTLSMLKEGQTISRTQYKSLYEEIRMCFSIYSKPDGDNMYCKIKKDYDLVPAEIYGNKYMKQVGTSNPLSISFTVEGTEPL